MAYEKKSVYKCKPMTDGKREIIQKLLLEYDIQDAGSLQEALKDLRRFSGNMSARVI